MMNFLKNGNVKKTLKIISLIIYFLSSIYFVVLIPMSYRYKELQEYILIIPDEIMTLSMIISIVGTFFLAIKLYNYIITISSKKIIHISKLDKIDFLGSKDLYRDIINSYSPIIISYIDQMKYDSDIATVSGLLSLKNKKIIDFTPNTIELLNNNSNPNILSLSEKYLLENIKNRKMYINKGKFKDIILKECLDKELIINQSNEKKYIIICLIVMLISYILMSFYISFLIVFCISSAAFVFFYIRNYAEIEPYRRTKKAKKLNKKLEGLKNYLKNYSMLEKKEAQAITLWEDYIIYSVIFKQNKNILLDYKKYYTKIEEKKMR